MGTDFPSLIWDHDGLLTGPERSAIAGSVLDAGCRFVVCGGHNCEAWHDETDAEYHRRHPNMEDDSFVITSCHEGESHEKVAFFFVRTTFRYDQPDVDDSFSKYLVVHVGSGKSVRQLDAAVLKCAVASARD